MRVAGASQYAVYLKPAAERALKRVKDDTARRRVVKAVDGLATNPRPPGAVAIQGGDRLLRIRAGDYRILYTVDDDVLTVLVVTIGHRRNVYQRERASPVS